MRRVNLLWMILILSGCHHNGRDALASHQIIAEPSNRWVHWEQEEPVDVTKPRTVEPIKPCQQLS